RTTTLHFLPTPCRLLSFRTTAPTHTSTLSLHTLFRSDARALDKAREDRGRGLRDRAALTVPAHLGDAVRPGLELDAQGDLVPARDRQSTRLNSSHVKIPYAVFCFKKKRTTL